MSCVVDVFAWESIRQVFFNSRSCFFNISHAFSEATLQSEHLQCIFGENLNPEDVFAIPSSKDMKFCVVFKLISLRPGNRMYLQRACSLSADATLPKEMSVF